MNLEIVIDTVGVTNIEPYIIISLLTVLYTGFMILA